MNRKLELGVLALCGGLIVGAAEGTINADNGLNIRLRPELKAPVMTSLKKGTVVDVIGRTGEFLEIAVPKTAPVFISAAYIGADKKLTRDLNMRSREAANSASYGILPAGTEVKVLKITRFGWAKIEPPASLRLYAARYYIDTKEVPPMVVPAEGKPVEAEKPVASVVGKTAPAAKPESSEKPAVPAAKPEGSAKPKKPTAEVSAPAPIRVEALSKQDSELQQLGVDLSKGVPAEGVGFLVELQSQTTAGVQYALTGDVDGVPQVMFFISNSKPLLMTRYLNKTVMVRGIAYNVPNWTHRVLKLESLELKK